MPPKVNPTHDSLRAQWARARHPSYGFCFRCGFPWPMVEIHDTRYHRGYGCFCLCEECWKLLGSPEARIEYYRMLIDYWDAQPGYKGGPPEKTDEDTVRRIGQAVANGG